MRHRFPSVFAALAALVPAGVAHAGGLLLPGSGPVSTGRAGAAVVSLDDPSAIGVNPAGLAGVEGTVIHVGSSLIGYHATFQRFGSYRDVADRNDPWEGDPYAAVSDESKPAIGIGEFQAVPVVAVASDLGRKVPGLVVAAGLFAPNAYPSRSYEADYQLEDPNRPPPPTRYDVTEQTAAIVLPSIAVAYTPSFLPALDVGVRFSSGFGQIEATTHVWGLPNFEEWTGRDGRFSVDVSDNFIPAFGAGARYRITPNLEVAAAWTSSLEFDGKGTGTSQVGSGADITGSGVPAVIIPSPEGMERCARGGTREALKACVAFSFPQTATLGGRYVWRDDAGGVMADVEANVSWEEWSTASDQVVIVDGWASIDGTTPAAALNTAFIKHKFEDVLSVRLGGSYARAMGPGLWTFRGGVAHDTAAAAPGWERLDIDGSARTTITAGASLTLARVRIDVGGGIVHEPARSQNSNCIVTQIGEGCGGGDQIPGPLRPAPDPVQPLADPRSQQQHPINDGAFSSGYGLLMVGVTTWFR